MTENISKPKKQLSKAETFQIIFENLEQLHTNGIPKELIISKLIESNVFSKVQANDYLKKLHNSGIIYEPSLGNFSMVC